MDWPTKEQIRASILAIWKAERPDADSTKYSDLWLYSRVSSVLVYRLHKTIKQALDAVFPTTAFDSYLDGLLSLFGLPDGQGSFGRILPHISAAASGFTIETVAGMGAGITLGQELTDSAGNVYVITENNGVIAPGGTEDVDIESVTTGYTVNLEAGTILWWVTPPAGADATGTLAKDLTGGKDLGEDSAEQSRLITRVRNPGLSGNVASWVQTIEAVSPGNLKAYVWPQRQNQPYGYGLTDYMALKTNERGTDRFILAADDLYDEIEAAVDAALPALIYRNSRQLTANGVLTDITLDFTLGLDATEDQKVDWDAVSANPAGANKTTVASNDGGGPNIVAVGDVCSTTITNGLEVGHRVVIDGTEGIVSAINVGANPKAFQVADWPDGWGTAANSIQNEYILAGGGFVGYMTDYANDITGTGLVGALGDFVDNRGPNVLYNAAQAQIPGWDSSIRIQQLESEAFVVGGGVIVAVSVTAPAGDISHAAQDGATAGVYYYSNVLAWQVWA